MTDIDQDYEMNDEEKAAYDAVSKSFEWAFADRAVRMKMWKGEVARRRASEPLPSPPVSGGE